MPRSRAPAAGARKGVRSNLLPRFRASSPDTPPPPPPPKTPVSATKGDAGDTTPKSPKTPKKENRAKDRKKKHRFLPGTVALREIRKLQKTSNCLIQKAPFQRMVRESMALHKADLKFKASALEAIQHATEAYMTSLFEAGVILQLHRGRKTLIARDLSYVLRIRGELMGGATRSGYYFNRN